MGTPENIRENKWQRGFRSLAPFVAVTTFLFALFLQTHISTEMGITGWEGDIWFTIACVFGLFVSYITKKLCEGVPAEQSLENILRKPLLRIFWYLSLVPFLLNLTFGLLLLVAFLFGTVETSIATLHIAGAIVVLRILYPLTHSLEDWMNDRFIRQRSEWASITLGVKVEDLLSETNLPEYVKLLANSYSSELLRNRVADLYDIFVTAWVKTGQLVQVIISLSVLWYTFTNNTDIAIYAWAVVGMEIAIPLVSLPALYACRLFTGRNPGEPKRTRKAISELIETNALFE
jgi:hypothetical protein